MSVTTDEPSNSARRMQGACESCLRDQHGISMSQATISNGKRMSTAACYLEPAKNRKNLRIETEALTERLILEGKRVVGVSYSQNGETKEARVDFTCHLHKKYGRRLQPLDIDSILGSCRNCFRKLRKTNYIFKSAPN